MKYSYKIGFARPAIVEETILIAQVYCDERSWVETRMRVLAEHLLQARTERTKRIVFNEVHKRLSNLNDRQIELIARGSREDVRTLIWIALCKQYRFIYDFTVEVLTKAYDVAAAKVTYDDYAVFFNAKAEWQPEIDTVSDKTKYNARRNIFLMMRQCGIITNDKELLPIFLSGPLRDCTAPEELALLPGAIR